MCIRDRILSFTGKLGTNKKEFGPSSTIKITVEDWDANVNVNAEDQVTVEYVIEGIVGTNTLTLEETDVSTGVFEGEIDLSTFNAEDIIGKRISIVYRDEADAAGKTSTAVVTVKVISVDPVIKFDEKYYDVGDVATITIEDLDANLDPDEVDRIELRVYSDSDPVGTTLVGVETGDDTGVFEATVLISETPGGGRVYAEPGDKIYVEYEDSFPADYAETGESKIFRAFAYVGIPVEKPITPEEAKFVDPMTGAEVTPTVGKMLGISVELKNVGITDQEFTVILVVKDPEGVTVKVDSISIPLAAGKSGAVRFSFTPKLVGDYSVEVYIVKSLADWTPLGEKLTTTLSVTG